ncbi:MAG: hypothetical protein QOG25_597, partial [Acetobacteraceae bacterium]|nr:hypothetical protein [Acetobacteraceae bacterium]
MVQIKIRHLFDGMTRASVRDLKPPHLANSSFVTLFFVFSGLLVPSVRHKNVASFGGQDTSL